MRTSVPKINKFIDACGWFGSLCLAICAVPEVWRALSADYYDISLFFVVLWLLGELGVLIPAMFLFKKPYIIVNISCNIMFILVILLRSLNVFGRIF